MIAVRPGKDAWRVLEEVVAHPGQLTAEAIGRRLWGPKITGSHDYLPARKAILVHGAKWTTDAARLLHRLQQAGLVERRRPPLVAARHLPAVMEMCAEADAGEVLEAREALLVDLVRRAPPTMREWVGAAPVGAVQRQVAALIEAGMVVAPSQRWPTEAGIRHLQECVDEIPTWRGGA